MAIHNFKVIPGSEAEHRLNELFKTFGVKRESVICRFGSLFGTEYDEYIFSDGLYDQIKDVLS